jgi:phage terminase large subunit-like protein
LGYMQGMAKKAASVPSALANFKTKDLNIWCNDAEGWFDDIAVGDRGGRVKFTYDMLKGRRCFGGIDLAATRDLTAFSLVFPPDMEGDPWFVLVWHWCPQEKVDLQEADDAANYKAWAQAGWLTPTEGNVTDYGPVKDVVFKAQRDFNVIEIGFDKWNFQQLSNEFTEAGVPLVEVIQRTEGMYPGSKKLEMLVYDKRALFQHGGNPVLRYCAQNVALLFDSNGNFRPDKKRSKLKGRIDGIVATVMALSRAVAVEEPDRVETGFVSL